MTIDDNVGFIGLGAMGLPMARNLLDAGVRLRLYNRTVEKADPLRASGAQVATRPLETVSKGGVLITMLADDRALESIIDENLLRALGNGGVHLSMSTIAPATARRLAELHTRNGVAYVSAPVFGRPDPAAARRLVICTSGPKVAKERVQHILKVMGQALFDFGEESAAANVVKISGNFLI